MSIQYAEIFKHGHTEVVSVQGKPYLFTNLRVDRKTVPEDLFAYDAGDDDCDGQCWRFQRHVLCNHWCTLIGKEPIELEDGVYYAQPDPEDENCSSEGWFLADTVESEEDYLERYDELKEKC